MFAEEARGVVKIEIGERRLSLNMDSDMIYYSLGDRTYRRTRMNDFIELRYINGKRNARLLDEKEKRGIANSFYSDIELVSTEYPFLKKHRKDYEFLKKRGTGLIGIYGEKIPIVPPDRYFSLYLRISAGCPWNKCSFCNLYKDQKYSPLPFSMVREQAERLGEFFKNSIESMNGIFLGDANAVSMSSDMLYNYFDYFREKFHMPFYAFSDAFTTPLRNTDFKMMREMGLKRIYIGIESGNPGILRMLNKKMDTQMAREFIGKIQDSGINVGLIVMSGFGKDHVRDTVKFLKSIEYSKGDIIYISPIKEYDNFHEILMENGMEIRNGEFTEIRDNLKDFLDIPVVIYNVDESLY